MAQQQMGKCIVNHRKYTKGRSVMPNGKWTLSKGTMVRGGVSRGVETREKAKTNSSGGQKKFKKKKFWASKSRGHKTESLGKEERKTKVRFEGGEPKQRKIQKNTKEREGKRIKCVSHRRLKANHPSRVG